MDFLDPVKKRAHLVRLYIGYGLVAALVVLTALILAFATYGWSIDRHTGDIIQNGLVFVSSQPSGASVFVNGEPKARTNTRLALPSGQYTVSLQRSGYRSWQRSFNLDGGSEEQLIYPILFPQKLITADDQLYGSAPTFASQSLDKRWLLVVQPGSLTTFDLYDLNHQTQPPTVVSLPPDLLTTSTEAQSLQPIAWASDNRHLLIDHLSGTTHEFILLDRQTPSDSVNLSKLIGTSTSTRMSLINKSPSQFYVYSAATEELESFTLQNPVPTSVLTHVLEYESYGTNTILYVSDAGAPSGQVAVKLEDSNHMYTLRDMAASSTYLLDLTRYEGHWYMACTSGAETWVYIYKDPQAMLTQTPAPALSPITYLKTAQPMFLRFSPNSQFLVAQDGSRFAVYDILEDRRYYYELKTPLPADQLVTWLDGYHLSLVQNGKIMVFDYDGVNRQTLVPAFSGHPGFFSPDYSLLYSLGPSVTVPGRSALTMTSLKIPK